MPYSSLISATDAAALIPEDVSREIWKGVTEQSAALSLFPHRRMSRAQQRIPVLSLKPTAYFVSGRTGLKQTTEVNWTNKYLDAEEIAVIVPVPESLMADVDYDLWSEIKPEIEEAIAVCLDDAVFFGTNAPSSWPTAIYTQCNTAGNTVTLGTSAVDYADDINTAMATVESDGYDVNGFWFHNGMLSKLRALRATTKEFLWIEGLRQGQGTDKRKGMTHGSLFGQDVYFTKSGISSMGVSGSKAAGILGDWSQGIVGIREDISYKVLDQAVIQDSNGDIMYNLAQQDMVALRVTFRVAWQIPNPINRANSTDATRYPFARLVSAS